MSITLTTKFADRIDERYYPTSITAAGTNQNYDWDGAKTIKVTSVGTVQMKNYTRATGYGAVSTADELTNTIQDLMLTKDRYFRAKLDKMDEEESKIQGADVLARQLREVTIPEIEAYRFQVMCKAIMTNSQAIEQKKGAYEHFLEANEKLDVENVPMETRVAYATPTFINALKLDPSFIKQGDLSQTMLLKGQVGEIDGVPVIKAPATWLKDDSSNEFDCIIVDRNATVAPLKLAEYQAILDHPDFSGTVFQGRFYYDAFVLDMKKKGLVGIKKKSLSA